VIEMPDIDALAKEIVGTLRRGALMRVETPRLQERAVDRVIEALTPHFEQQREMDEKMRELLEPVANSPVALCARTTGCGESVGYCNCAAEAVQDALALLRQAMTDQPKTENGVLPVDAIERLSGIVRSAKFIQTEREGVSLYGSMLSKLANEQDAQLTTILEFHAAKDKRIAVLEAALGRLQLVARETIAGAVSGNVLYEETVKAESALLPPKEES